jgi:hypothetical protein
VNDTGGAGVRVAGGWVDSDVVDGAAGAGVVAAGLGVEAGACSTGVAVAGDAHAANSNTLKNGKTRFTVQLLYSLAL